MALTISRTLLDELVAHAREDAPNECCGIVGGSDGTATRVFRARNAAASPYRYELDPRDQIAIFDAVDDEGLEVVAIYHSHTRSAPEPSQTDINLAFFPDVSYVIVGIGGEEADVRAWRIVDGAVSPDELLVGD